MQLGLQGQNPRLVVLQFGNTGKDFPSTFGGTQQPCGDHLHPIQLSSHGGPSFEKKWPTFFLCHVEWPHVTQVRFWQFCFIFMGQKVVF